MKLNKETLKRIIKEELEAVLGESRILSKYVKDKKEEFRQYLQDMGKDPDEVRDALGHNSYNVMGQTLVNNYPGTMPLSRDSKIRLAYKLINGPFNSFYSPDSTGSSPFSKILELLPELREDGRVKRAINQAGGDPKKVVAGIGKSSTHLRMRNLIERLYYKLENPWGEFKK